MGTSERTVIGNDALISDKIEKHSTVLPSVAGRVIFSTVSVGFKADLSNDSTS